MEGYRIFFEEEKRTYLNSRDLEKDISTREIENWWVLHRQFQHSALSLFNWENVGRLMHNLTPSRCR
jgi:hypothetical protein